ncbi:DUF2378 family protein [Archangium violaceum]|uniref:TIGR02265 family protein n=1 Tax=Archangium violaceum TaxID=83451 RepID=UPI001950092A|nr:DUF2378 family protein [Archangium violaceum]QRO00533.1 DUF2378 family protein [Archangium violaceum]
MGDDTGSSHSLGSEEELRRRLTYVTPADTTRGIFLNSVLEVVRQLGDEATVRHCLDESGETRFVALFNYPVSTLLRMSYAGARRLSNDSRNFEEVMRQMGYLSARSFATTSMGQIMLRQILGQPRRLLENLPAAYRMTTNVGTCKVRWTGHTSAVILITRDILPYPYMEGSLQGTFEVTAIRGLTVRAHPLESLDTEYELSWG